MAEREHPRRPKDGAAWHAVLIGLALVCATGSASAASKEDRVFTVGNYPVEARAADAVAAKERALAEGQKAALRSLLKRLVPVTSYRRLAKVRPANASQLVESFAVRSERNSSTEYIASYDFVFSPDPVRRLLDAEGIPYLDRQAPTISIVPAYKLPPELAGKLPATFSAAAGADTWLYAWKALDLANSLTPATLMPLKREVHPDTIRGLADGDLGFLRSLATEYQTETVLVAILEPEAAQKRIKVVLAGRDAVQTMYLKRTYRLDGHDLAYTAELAAVVSLAILEGRWKAINVRGEPNASAGGFHPPAAAGTAPGAAASPSFGGGPGHFAGAGGGPMTVAISFNGMGEWQQISRQLAQTPDIEGLEVLGLSARGARVALNYPGGPERLAAVLAGQGLILQNGRGGWVLSRR
ncbi:MAG: DUF2066 domain-containing protein [Hyphomicrobiaceae bacterium]|nr:DUF2066 domain-containing protein [Hyphomicrobiaceae bacterium]